MFVCPRKRERNKRIYRDRKIDRDNETERERERERESEREIPIVFTASLGNDIHINDCA